MEKPKRAATGRDSDKYIVRFPEGMRDRITELAKSNGRSINAEIITRLEWAMSLLGKPTTLPEIPVVSGDIPYGMAQDIARLAVESGISFDQMLARIFVAGIHPDSPQVVYMPVLPGAVGKDVGATLRAMGEFIRPDATIVSEMVTRWSALADMAPPSKKPATNEPSVAEQVVREPGARRVPKSKK